MNAAEDAAPWQPPRTFDEYELMEPIGNGSMGQVYRALDTVLQRQVAVKVIRGRVPDAAQRERFLVEARAIARMQHPNVVEIYRAWQVQGRPYLVSELIRGKSLDRVELPLPPERALEIAIELARGLAAVHRRGVLHRDIKPANVMLGEDGTVKLLDFGVAKLIDAAGPPATVAPPRRAPADRPGDETQDAVGAAPAVSRVGTPAEQGLGTGVIGTPRYMAPEVRRQEPATARSDLYSFGVLLYQLCTGVLPEPAQGAEPTPLARRAAEIDPAFAAAVDRCLAPDPEARFPSAEALREALEALRGDPAQVGIRERPYPGLHAFGAGDRGTFFGRDAQVRAVLDRLRGEPLVLVAGDSGAGKSSLCRAGVLPRVAEGALGPGGAWATCELLPGRRPLQALASALAPLLGCAEAEAHAVLSQRPNEAGRWTLHRVRAGGLVALVDQLEEVLTLAGPEELEPFTSALRSLAGCGPRIRVLATVRGDFLARLAALPGLGEPIAGGLYLMPHLGEAGLRDAITAPARTQGYAFESEAMIDALVAAGRAEGGLPLLQFALAELWERRERDRKIIPARALEALGGVEGALARHADGVLAQMRPGPRDAARRVLLRLVLAEGTRAERSREELVGEPGAEDAEAKAALEALVRGRLVLGRESPQGSPTYELAHEALLRGWDTLRAWQSNDQERRALRQRLERACAEWERLGRPREQLWGRRQLAEARALRPGELSRAESSFLRASRGASRRRTLLVAVALLIAPVSAAGAYGGIQARAWLAREREVARLLQTAGADMDDARSRSADIDQARQVALGEFDDELEDQDAKAEADWAKALGAAADQRLRYQRAIEALDGARSLEGRRADLRLRLADALFEYLEIAERDRLGDLEDHLRQRIELLDDGGDLRRRLMAPGRLTVTSAPAGAKVWIEAADTSQEPWKWGARPEGGSTPLEALSLPPGSYRLHLRRGEGPEVVAPVLVLRGKPLALHVPIPGRVPPGYAYVPPGRFLYGSSEDEKVRSLWVMAKPVHPRETAGFFIGRTEVTFGEWMEFLRDRPGAREARTPGASNGTVAVRLERAGSGWRFFLQHSVEEPYRALEGEDVHYRDRRRNGVQDWRRFPVSGISWEDARAYALWLGETGRLPGARLCTELEWERAARGADAREYPHGNELAPDDANFDATYERRSFGPDAVGLHPASDSVFGVSDLSGNVWEWVVPGDGSSRVAYAGGGFYQNAATARITTHGTGEKGTRSPWIGFRICAPAAP